MFIFQVIAFVVEFLFIILVGGISTIYILIGLIKKIKTTYMSKSFSRGRKSKHITSSLVIKTRTSLFRWVFPILAAIILGTFTIYFIKPYVFDLPKLVTGKFSYVSGNVYHIKTGEKSLYRHVYIGSKEVTFFFSSNVKNFDNYKVGYLPNTDRAIYGESLDWASQETGKKIAFPLKDLVIFVGIFVAIFTMIGVAPYLRFKSLIAVSLFYYPFSIFLFIKNGLNTGTWFSFTNKGLLLLTIGMGISLFIFLLSKLESRLDENQSHKLMFAVQLSAVMKILSVIAVISKK